jgi:hypothetical protein
MGRTRKFTECIHVVELATIPLVSDQAIGILFPVNRSRGADEGGKPSAIRDFVIVTPREGFHISPGSRGAVQPTLNAISTAHWFMRHEAILAPPVLPFQGDLY